MLHKGFTHGAASAPPYTNEDKTLSDYIKRKQHVESGTTVKTRLTFDEWFSSVYPTQGELQHDWDFKEEISRVWKAAQENM